MDKLIEIIVNLKSDRPKYYIDVYNVDDNTWLKKKYTLEKIIAENPNVVAWFKNLGTTLQIQQWTPNGTTFFRKGEPIIVNFLNQQVPTSTPTPIQDSGLKGGLNAIKLQVNNELYEDLKIKHAELKQDYKAAKKKNKKIKETLQELERELYELNFEKEKQPLITDKTIEKYSPIVTGLLAKIIPQPAQGLNAPQEEQLPQEVASFINFVKTHENPVMLVGILGSLYTNFLKAQETNNQTQQAQA